MASVLKSANRSTVSVFDSFGAVAETAGKTIRTLSRTIDTLDAKAEVMHARVVANSRAQICTIGEEEAMAAASDHTDMLFEIHRKNFPNKEFNRAVIFQESLNRIREAMAD